MNRLALFDCDGTLVDSQQPICTALAAAFAAEGLPGPSRAAGLDIVGLSLPQAMARLHPAGSDADHLRLAAGYKAAFFDLRAQGGVAEPLYPGIAALVAALAAAGWRLGVATGKSARGLAFCLAHHGLADRFLTLQTADGHPSKPHPSMIRQAMLEADASPETTVMIGDTRYDMAMAKAAGCAAAGVAWGYHPRADLIAAGADMVAADAGELHAWLAARA